MNEKGRVVYAMVRKRLHDSGDVLLEKGKLAKLRLSATRSGLWFKALRRIDRVLIDLTLRVCDKVQGHLLARALLSVISRLENALERKVSEVVAEIGPQLALKVSRIGRKLGNSSAHHWAKDMGFARFLAVMYINNCGELKP